jgi:mono/diheme cytochrome c family protein
MKGAALWRFAGPCLFVALSVVLAALAFFSGCSNKVVTPVYTPQQIARGEYLANFVSACVDCHTPLNPDGSLDT